MKTTGYNAQDCIEIGRYRRLYSAVIRQACVDYLDDSNRGYSAKSWLFDNDTINPNSFINLCLFLDFDVQRVRDRLVQLKVDKIPWSDAEKSGREVVNKFKPISEDILA